MQSSRWVFVSKAGGHAYGSPARETYIAITRHIPEYDAGEARDRVYHEQAQLIAKTLWDALPAGTYALLAAKMAALEADAPRWEDA